MGLGVLRLSPDVFWRMTVPEFEAAVRGLSGRVGAQHQAMSRTDLSALMQKFPDKDRNRGGA